jgi:hypothetical protein
MSYNSFRIEFIPFLIGMNEMSIQISIQNHVNTGQDFILEWKVQPGELLSRSDQSYI